MTLFNIHASFCGALGVFFFLPIFLSYHAQTTTGAAEVVRSIRRRTPRHVYCVLVSC